MLSPGVFELGKVQMDRNLRTVAFPAELNKRDVPMEYFLVTDHGKIHESILRTDASPYYIHLAMLLLGAQGAGTNAFPAGSPLPVSGPVKNPSKEALPGDRISIEVSWQEKGQPIRRRAGELIFNEQTRASLDSERWVYNGSVVINGNFIAQQDGSIISLITDPIALINSTVSGHDNDQIWRANTNSLPPDGVPDQVTLKLEDSARR